MDTQSQWASVVEAASDPDRTHSAEHRVLLLKAALELGHTITPDSVGTSITLTEGAGYVTPAASSGVALDLDLAQYVDHDGPCVAACRDGQPHSIVIMSEENEYGRFTATALEHGVLSSLSLPLPSRPASALNLYASSVNAFTGDRERSTAALLAQCVVRFLPEPPAQGSTGGSGLIVALERRELIRQARDHLVERDGIQAAEAFGVLTDRSRREQRSIFDVATEVVDSARGGRS